MDATKTPIRVAIVDPFSFLREALRLVLRRDPLVEIVGEAADGFGAVALVESGKADVMILEPLLPKKSGIDIIKEADAGKPKTKILILTMDTTRHYAFRLLRAGAMGWIPKNAGSEEILKALHLVREGKVYIPNELQAHFAERYVHPKRLNQNEDRLSDREFQVMRLLALGHSNREIAEMLFVGMKTVDTHRANILRKLGLRNNSDLTRFAIRHGFVTA